METVILYSTGCPKCSVLKKKLEMARLDYEEVTDMAEMRHIGLKAAPALFVNGELKNFSEAVRWVNDYVSECTPSD